MDVQVIYKRLQLGSRHPAWPSLLGDGLPDRLRSTTIALLGVVAAVGLGIVAFALQLGFPLAGGEPLPDVPIEQEAAPDRGSTGADAVRSSRPVTAEEPGERLSATADEPVAPAPVEGAEPRPSGVLVTGSAPVAEENGKRPQAPDRPATSPSPASTAVPDSASDTAPSPPAPPTASSSELPPPPPAPEAAAPQHPGKGNAYGKANGKGLGNGGIPPGQAAKLEGTDEPSE